jgi:transcriptional regulator with GAF, ATPase, and Fis domain
VLQNKEIERVGGTGTIPVDVRIITATHRNLEKMIASEHFREDLWYRLNTFPIIIPPLRQRKEDIPALVQ